MNSAKVELIIIEKQMGRRPRGTLSVVNRCDKQVSTVIVTHPLLESRPFPTLYYLTCPFLVKEVSKLEESGLILGLQRLLAADEALQRDFFQAQNSYREKRFSLLSPKERSKLDPSGAKVLKKNGIAGVKNLSQIKCLHAHYAHFLASGDNPVGEKVHQGLNKKMCPKDCWIC